MSDAAPTFWPGDRLVTLTSAGTPIQWVVEPDGWLHQTEDPDECAEAL